MRIGRVVFAATAAVMVAVTTAAAGVAQRSPAKAEHACAVRWNWTPMRGIVPFDPSRPAEVLADPCRVYVYYDGGAKNIEGDVWMPCLENRYRGYGCATHAMDVRSAGRTIKPNAFYNPRTGFLRLAGASKPAFAPKPEWIRRWRWDNGFVVPFDRRGHIQPGTTAHRIATRAAIVEGCGPPVYSLLAYCSAGGVAIYSRWPLRNGDLIAVSGVILAGTTTYDIYTYKAS